MFGMSSFFGSAFSRSRRQNHARGKRAAELQATPGGRRAQDVERSLSSLKLRIAEMIRGEDFDCPRPPGSAERLVRVTHDAEPDGDALAELITLDPFLTGRMLSLAARSGCVTPDPLELVEALGARAVHEDLYRVAQHGRVFREGDLQSLMKQQWVHATGCGRVTEFVAEWIGVDQPWAYTAGLMHDVAKPVVLSVIATLKRRGVALQIPGFDTTEELMQALHPEVGLLLAHKWDLPRPVADAIRWHHYLDGAATENRELVLLVNLANTLCHHLGVGCPAEHRDITRMAVTRELDLDDDAAQELVNAVSARSLDYDFLPLCSRLEA